MQIEDGHIVMHHHHSLDFADAGCQKYAPTRAGHLLREESDLRRLRKSSIEDLTSSKTHRQRATAITQLNVNTVPDVVSPAT